MARKIIIPIPDFTHTEKTFLDADYSSGTALTVVNNFGFALNDILIAGQPGVEKSESQVVASQTGNTVININSALKFTHQKSDVIYRFEYDQYEIYRYRSSAWTLISTSNIQWDKLETIYIDADGTSTDSYRYRLINSASAATSDYSPTLAATGFTRSQVGYMVSRVRTVLGDTERKIIKTDDELINQFNRAQEIIRSVRSDWWFLRKENSSITTVANQRKYGLNTYLSDMNYIDSVRYNFNDGTTNVIYQLTQLPFSEWDAYVRNNNDTADDYPSSYVIQPPDDSDATGYIELNIKSKTTAYGTFYIRYFATITDLDDVSDATLIPIPSILEDFALSYGFQVKGDDTRAKIYEQRFYGPQPGRQDASQSPSGLRLLELMQKEKGRAVGQAPVLKRYMGPNGWKKLTGERSIDRDSIHTNYF